MTKKGARQENCAARKTPTGTPATEATEKAVITMPIALALRSKGTKSLTADNTKAPNNPPKAPVMARAARNK